MLNGNQLAQALSNAGLGEIPTVKPKRGKKFTCNKCGETMIRQEGSNVMYCRTCEKPSYFIFDKK